MPSLHTPRPDARPSLNLPAPRPLNVDALNPRIEALVQDGALRPRSRAGTPRSTKSRTSRAGTPRDGTGAALADGDASRPLNVTDALSYLDAVKNQFSDKPDVYNHFLDIMKDFKSQAIDTPGVIERVSMLFQGNPQLIQGFNTFLPPGYRIDCSTDIRNHSMITVTTPNGVVTQAESTPADGIFKPLRIPRETPGNASAMPTPPPGPSHSTQGPSSMPHMPQPAPPMATPPVQAAPQPPFSSGLSHPLPPIGSGAASRPVTPLPYQLPHLQGAFGPGSGPAGAPLPAPYSPGIHGTQSAATFLNGLNPMMGGGGGGGGPAGGGPPHGDVNQAISFLNKIKTYFANDGNTYKQFLEILQAYQKDQRNVEDSQVYAQVQILFKDAPDLFEDFKRFLPSATAGPAHPAGMVGILPHPAAVAGHGWLTGEGAPPLPEPERATERNAVAGPSVSAPAAAARAVKRKKRTENEPAPSTSAPKASSSRAKRPKTQPRNENASPADSPHHRAVTPGAFPYAPMAHSTHTHDLPPGQIAMPPGHVAPAPAPQSVSAQVPAPARTSDEQQGQFFDTVKRILVTREAYDDFLRLLDLYAQEVIDAKSLVLRMERLLGNDYLVSELRAILGAADERGAGPPGSIRTSPPEALLAAPTNEGQGASYRRLTDSEIRLACSGRDELARSVLNDEWVSHPTWASEEAGFVAHKKNQFEEALARSEEERHEFTVNLQGLQRTIAVLEPIAMRIEEMTPEERLEFQLRVNLGGQATSIYKRTIKKIYGKEQALEVYEALLLAPAQTVPVVLERLRAKDLEWRRAQREWARTWREVDHKNFYKSLDHQGVKLKNVDKKTITAKHFAAEIEALRQEQLAAAAASFGGAPAWARGSLGPQLEFDLVDDDLRADVSRVVLSYLDHNHGAYSPAERRAIEEFLHAFLPLLFVSAPSVPVAAGAAPESQKQGGVPDIEMQNAGRSNAAPLEENGNAALEAATLVLPGSDHPGRPKRAEDAWVDEVAPASGEDGFVDGAVQRRPLFANSTLYTLLRLYQLLYARLIICKDAGARLARERYASLSANPVAVALGLEDPAGPPSVLQQLLGPGAETGGDGAGNVLYAYVLDALDRLFDGDMDQATFEEHMRWFFGTVAYHTYNTEKVVLALIKQVQTIVSDNKCQELWDLFQKARESTTVVTPRDLIRYRREAESNVSSNEQLYRVEWAADSGVLAIQVLSAAEPSVDEAGASAVQRWREYVESYVTTYPTEWAPPRSAAAAPSATRRASGCSPLFLRRNLQPTTSDGARDKAPAHVSDADDMAIRVSLGTYRLFFEAGGERACVRTRRADAKETAELARLAEARAEGRRRYLRTQYC